jgi:Transglutaminase-like superfamily
VEPSYYAQPGPLTQLSSDQVELVRHLGTDPERLCRYAQAVLTPVGDAYGSGLSPVRMAERNTRPATALLLRALELDSSPLSVTRRPEHRVVGTCRHFAVLATAYLRAVAIPARARCGFAAYFVPGKYVDHWIVEYWADAERWVRIDPENLGTDVVQNPHDLARGQFLTGGEGWECIRNRTADPMQFGVVGTENWGAAEIRGNAIRDLASLNKVEMLPWDAWGPMEASYKGETAPELDQLIDEVAAACRDECTLAPQAAYAWVAVPAEMIC